MANGKKENAIGLVLNTAEMRAVELSGSVQHPKVVAFGRIALPDGLIADGMITDTSAAASSLAQLLRSKSFSAAPLLVGVKNQNVLLRMASFPKVPPDKTRNAILYQAQQFIPVPVAELVLDFVLCGEVPESDPPMVNALLVGAKKAFLNGVIECVQAADRTLGDIDSGVLASVRAAMAAEIDKQQTILLADVDSETISMAICRGDTILMIRTVPLPAQFLQIAAAASTESPALDEQAEGALAAQLAADIGASIRYFATQREETLSSVRLTGSLRQIDSIAQRTGELLGVPVRVPALYPGLGNIDTLQYATCISLALRGLEG